MTHHTHIQEYLKNKEHALKKLLLKELVTEFVSYDALISEIEDVLEKWLDNLSEKDYDAASKKAMDLTLYFKENDCRLSKQEGMFKKISEIKDFGEIYKKYKVDYSEHNLPDTFDNFKEKFEALELKSLDFMNKEGSILLKSDHPTHVYTYFFDEDRKKDPDIMFA
jgi:hypothetical protein